MVDDARELSETIGDLFPRRCRPPRLRSTERTPPDEALDVDDGVRRFLVELGDAGSGRADAGQDYAARGQRQRDPLSSNTGDVMRGAPGEIPSVRLVVLPMTPGELLGCWVTSDPGDRQPASDAVLGRWRSRWRATPYAIHDDKLWVHVPTPPQRLGAIASVALEIAHVSPTLRLEGTEQYFVQAASHHWPVDRDGGGPTP